MLDKFGLVGGLIVYVAYKEIPMFLKKRNGDYVSYTEIRDIKRKLDAHLSDSTGDVITLESFKARQEQINLKIDDNITQLRSEISEVKDDVREVRDVTSEIKTLLIRNGVK